jgi:hypothetical protein
MLMGIGHDVFVSERQGMLKEKENRMIISGAEAP